MGADREKPQASAATATTTALLDSLANEADGPVWSQFDARYRPIVRGVALRLGLPAEDAADVAQETLASFVRDYRRGLYQRGRGRLRSWIVSIARNRAIDLLRARQRRRAAGGDSVVAEVPDVREVDAVWEEEERRSVYEAALQQLRASPRIGAENLKAFELVALRGVSVEQAAAECGMSANQVYLAKLRMVERLKKLVAEISIAYEQDV